MSPKNGQSHLLIEHLPEASASFRVVKDSGGNPADLVFRDVNPAFEAMFGLNKEEIIGKRAIDVFLETETVNFDWLGKVAAASSTARFEYYSELQRRRYEVTAYHDSSSYVLVVLRVMAPGEMVVGMPPKNHPEPELNAGEERKQMKEALPESEEKLRFLAENVGDILWILDSNLHITYLSQSVFNTLGFTPEEAKRRPLNERVTPESLAYAAEALEEELQREASGSADPERVRTMELEYYHKNGSIVWMEDSIKGLRDSKGELVGFYGVSRDITRRKQAEDRLKALKEEYKTVFHGTRDALFLVEVIDNKTFRYIRNNRSHEEKTGLSAEQMKGKTPQELLGEEYGKRIALNYMRCVKAAAPLTYEETLDLPAGTRTWTTTLTPVFQGDEIGYIVGSSQDITEHKNAEDALKASERKYREILSTIEEGYYETDLKGNFVFFNDTFCKVLGYSRDELMRQSYKKLFQNPKEVFKTFSRVYRTGKPETTASWPVITKDGREFFAELSVVLRRGESGNPIGFRGIAKDVTERKRAEQVLQDTRRRLDEIIEFLPDATFVIDEEGKVIAWNKAIESLTGIPGIEMIGKGNYEHAIPFYGKRRPILIDLVLLPNAEFEKMKKEYDVIEKRGNLLYSEVYVPHVYCGKGAYLWATASRLHDSEGNVVGAIETLRDITERKHYEEKLKYLSLHDQLTGLYNRAFFDEEMKRLAGSREYPITVISADLDELKLINDTMGHARGDELLQACAEVLRKSLRSSDILARVGGDEFAVLLPRTDGAAGEEITKRIQSNTALHNRERPALPISISLGVAVAASKDTSLEETYKKADDLMFREKLFSRDGARSRIIDSFLTALEERGHLAGSGAERLSALCLAIGERLGLSSSRLADLHLLARAHDLGKVTVPENILFKKSPLSEEEWEIIRQHTEKGCNIAASSSELARVADLILKHHERWDGQGYPLGLKGEEIPLECRIFAIANAFDAMTGDRPYREKRSKEEALQELRRCAGTQFDPELVELFLEEFGKQTT